MEKQLLSILDGLSLNKPEKDILSLFFNYYNLSINDVAELLNKHARTVEITLKNLRIKKCLKSYQVNLKTGYRLKYNLSESFKKTLINNIDKEINDTNNYIKDLENMKKNFKK